jgi:hypothetical protein
MFFRFRNSPSSVTFLTRLFTLVTHTPPLFSRRYVKSLAPERKAVLSLKLDASELFYGRKQSYVAPPPLVYSNALVT